MSFLVLPPEINSLLMYAGAGSAPMLAAASAWDGLATEVAAMVGYHGGVSAAAAQLTSWSAAVQGLPAQASAAIATNPVGAAVTSATSAASSDPITALFGPVEQSVTGYVSQAEQAVINVLNAPTSFLLGHPLIG